MPTVMQDHIFEPHDTAAPFFRARLSEPPSRLRPSRTYIYEPTFREQLVRARRGQGVFRANVLLREGYCRVTRVNEPRHLTASHIKPWRDATDTERLGWRQRPAPLAAHRSPVRRGLHHLLQQPGIGHRSRGPRHASGCVGHRRRRARWRLLEGAERLLGLPPSPTCSNIAARGLSDRFRRATLQRDNQGMFSRC